MVSTVKALTDSDMFQKLFFGDHPGTPVDSGSGTVLSVLRQGVLQKLLMKQRLQQLIQGNREIHGDPQKSLTALKVGDVFLNTREKFLHYAEQAETATAPDEDS